MERAIKVARQDMPASANAVSDMFPDGVHPDRAHSGTSSSLWTRRQIGGGERAEQRLFDTFESEESKEDGAHTPDPPGRVLSTLRWPTRPCER